VHPTATIIFWTPKVTKRTNESRGEKKYTRKINTEGWYLAIEERGFKNRRGTKEVKGKPPNTGAMLKKAGLKRKTC